MLDPYLFITYINQLGDNMNASSIQIYADDTVLYNSDPTELKIDLQNAVNWCSDNLLILNAKKTKWMILVVERERERQTERERDPPWIKLRGKRGNANASNWL